MVRPSRFLGNIAQRLVLRDDVPLVQAIFSEPATTNALGEAKQEATRTSLFAPDRDIAPGRNGCGQADVSRVRRLVQQGRDIGLMPDRLQAPRLPVSNVQFRVSTDQNLRFAVAIQIIS